MTETVATTTPARTTAQNKAVAIKVLLIAFGVFLVLYLVGLFLVHGTGAFWTNANWIGVACFAVAEALGAL